MVASTGEQLKLARETDTYLLIRRCSDGQASSPYPEEFRAQMAEADRTPEQISPKFEPTAQTIINWMAPANRDAGVRQDGL
jgi:hypothetical protein